MDTSYSSKGSNYTDLLLSNRSLIIKLMMRAGSCTRSELAKMSGLSQAAITKIAGGLIELGIIEEVGLSKGKMGRRTIELQLKSDKYAVIGIKIGRKSYSAGVFDLSGRPVFKEKCSIYPHQAATEVVASIAKWIHTYSSRYSNVIAAGISVPGPYLRREGVIAKMTEFPGWKEINLISYFREHVTLPVFVEHDANAGALAEWWFGNTQAKVLVHIIASEGIGAGIISNGHLLYGAAGIAGEIGHMSIAFDGRHCECAPQSRGCLEQYCSSLAFMRDVREHMHAHPDSILHQMTDFSIQDVFSAAHNGDNFCISMIMQLGFYFGVGISNLINVYNPDTIIISDIMAGAGDILLDSIRQTVLGRIIPELSSQFDIRFSSTPYDASLYGAAAIAVDRFLENPLRFIEGCSKE